MDWSFSYLCMHARKDSMDPREFKFIFVGVALVVLIDGAIIPTWWDWLKLLCSSSKACRSIVGDAIQWRLLIFLSCTTVKRSHFYQRHKNLAIVKIDKHVRCKLDKMFGIWKTWWDKTFLIWKIWPMTKFFQISKSWSKTKLM